MVPEDHTADGSTGVHVLVLHRTCGTDREVVPAVSFRLVHEAALLVPMAAVLVVVAVDAAKGDGTRSLVDEAGRP